MVPGSRLVDRGLDTQVGGGEVPKWEGGGVEGGCLLRAYWYLITASFLNGTL